jgi:hypothetical protein
MEKYYRLHGFPPGFKFSKGIPTAEQHFANQASEMNMNMDSPSAALPIIQEQIQQLFAMMKSNNSEVISSVNQVGAPQNCLVANMSGTSFNPFASLNDRYHHSVFSSISSFQVASKLVNQS